MTPFRAHRPLKNEIELDKINQKLDELSVSLRELNLCPGNATDCEAYIPGFCAMTGNKTKKGLPCQMENDLGTTKGEREFIKSS